MSNLSENAIRLCEDFVIQQGITQPGSICAMIGMTDKARQKPLPYRVEDFYTKAGALSVSGGKIKSILKAHGETRLKSTEGGRTSRGNLERGKAYIELLNELHSVQDLNLDCLLSFWVKKVQVFLANEPLILRNDATRSIRKIVRELLRAASERQKQRPGTNIAGIVLEHMVGAKLEIAMTGRTNVVHKGASVADKSTDSPGDFLILNTAIHVTTFPGDNLISKCKANLDRNIRPIIVTMPDCVTVASKIAEQHDVDDRIEIFDAEQFVAMNVYEWSGFSASERQIKIEHLVEIYNRIIGDTEGDPSLKIRISSLN